MSMTIKRSDEEIQRVLGWAIDRNASGETYFGMTYEEGVLAALDWLTGNTDDAPDDE